MRAPRLSDDWIICRPRGAYEDARLALRGYAEGRGYEDAWVEEEDISADAPGDLPYRAMRLVVRGDMDAEQAEEIARLAVQRSAVMVMALAPGGERVVSLSIYRYLDDHEEAALAARMQADARMGGAA